MNTNKNTRQGKNCVIWTRVSTAKQEENGGSLEYQKQLCEKFAKDNGLKVRGYFGGTHESAKVPGHLFKGMIAAVKKDTSISLIVCSEFDRFSRDAAQAIGVIRELYDLGVSVCSVKQGIRTDTKDNIMMASTLLLMATWDNDKRTDKFYSGRQHCYESGAYTGVLPRGYYREGKSVNSVCYLNDEGRLIGLAFKMKLHGYSNGEILDALKNRGLDITKQSLNHYFNNPFYAGKIQSKLLTDGMVDGKIEKAISYDDWLEVQRIMSNRSGKYKHKKKKENFPLTPHVACADCGTRFTAYRVKSKGKDYYKCNRIGCKNNVSAAEMHCKYKQLLYAYDAPMSVLLQHESIIRDMFRAHTQESANQVTILRKRLTDIENDLKTCYMKYATGKLDDDAYNVTIDELKRRKANIEKDLEQYNLNLSNLDDKINAVVVTCSKLGSLWEQGDVDTKKRIQELVFPNGILWDRVKRNYRTENRNKFFDLLDRFSVSYGHKKETPSYEDVSECAG